MNSVKVLKTIELNQVDLAQPKPCLRSFVDRKSTSVLMSLSIGQRTTNDSYKVCMQDIFNVNHNYLNCCQNYNK